MPLLSFFLYPFLSFFSISHHTMKPCSNTF
jgi:hypothetical protein